MPERVNVLKLILKSQFKKIEPAQVSQSSYLIYTSSLLPSLICWSVSCFPDVTACPKT